MNLKDIKALISIVEKAGITSLSVEEDNVKIEIKKERELVSVGQLIQSAQPFHVPAPGAAHAAAVQPAEHKPAHQAQAAEEPAFAIKSPMVGTFYSAPSPDSPPYVKVGDHIDKGTTVCIIEAMKLFNEIESEFTGTIEKVFLKNGDPVEYGQVLFTVKPD